MQIFIRTPLGNILTHTFGSDASIDAVKAAVEDHEFIPADTMRVAFGTTTLHAGCLGDFNVRDGDQLEVMLSVMGGMRQKWRKKRMRRLRRKRRKMRQRAR